MGNDSLSVAGGERTALLALAERVEQATGPDRELDALIAVAAKAVPDDMEPCFGTGWWRGKYDDRHWQAPAYTASLNDAMMLVPEGWLVQLSDWEDEALREHGPWQAILVPRGKRDDFRHGFDARCDHAVTPALALTAAALRAHASNRGAQQP